MGSAFGRSCLAHSPHSFLSHLVSFTFFLSGPFRRLRLCGIMTTSSVFQSRSGWQRVGTQLNAYPQQSHICSQSEFSLRIFTTTKMTITRVLLEITTRYNLSSYTNNPFSYLRWLIVFEISLTIESTGQDNLGWSLNTDSFWTVTSLHHPLNLILGYQWFEDKLYKLSLSKGEDD